MKISNKSRIVILRNFCIINTVLFLLIGIGWFLISILSQRNLLPSQFLIFLIILLFYFGTIGKQIFEYDTTGEVFIIINKNMYFSQNKADEFPKYLMKDYKIETGFLKKRLILKILMRNKIIILKYDITLVNDSLINQLKNNLEAVMNNNNNNK